MKPEYFWTVVDFDISKVERARYHGVKTGFLLDEGFVLKNKPKTEFVLGKNTEEKYMTADLAELGSVIIAGEDGSPIIGDDKSGRFNFTESIVAEYLVGTMPDEDRLILIGSRIDWFHCKDLPSSYVTVIDNPGTAVETMNKLLYNELMDRYKLFEHTEDENLNKVKCIEEYNRIMKKRSDKEMPYIVVVINELEELMKHDSEAAEEAIYRLAELGRSVGIFLVVGTRHPVGNVLTERIKKAIPVRIAFKMKDEKDSIAVMGIPGAEVLNGNGDMLFHKDSKHQLMHLQAALLGSENMDNIIWQYIELKKDIKSINLARNDPT